MKWIALFTCLACLLPIAMLQAQPETPVLTKEYVDLVDVISLVRGKNAKVGSGAPEKGKLMLIAAPIFGTNPSLGAFYGLGGTGAMFLGNPATTNVSNLNASVLYTTKKQFVVSLKGTVMTANNGWEMLVDVKYSFFSENAYGLGSDYSQPIHESWNIGGIETTGLKDAQSLTFNNTKVYYTALKRVAPSLYVGVGYHLDSHYNIKDESLNLKSPEPVVTSHYAYNVQKGFNPEHYLVSGLSANVIYDSRDHTLNPYKGAFLQLSYRYNPTYMGSDKESQQLYMEARVYKTLNPERPRHLIALWGIAHFITTGAVPYLDLPAHAYDMRNRIGRGYPAGRFRGPSWIAAELEYRFPLTWNGLLGGVLFGSATSTSREAIAIGTEHLDRLNLLEAIRPAGGAGLRLMLNRTGRLNLTADMAFGQQGSKGFYLAVGETF